MTAGTIAAQTRNGGAVEADEAVMAGAGEAAENTMTMAGENMRGSPGQARHVAQEEQDPGRRRIGKPGYVG